MRRLGGIGADTQSSFSMFDEGAASLVHDTLAWRRTGKGTRAGPKTVKQADLPERISDQKDEAWEVWIEPADAAESVLSGTKVFGRWAERHMDPARGTEGGP